MIQVYPDKNVGWERCSCPSARPPSHQRPIHSPKKARQPHRVSGNENDSIQDTFIPEARNPRSIVSLCLLRPRGLRSVLITSRFHHAHEGHEGHTDQWPVHLCGWARGKPSSLRKSTTFCPASCSSWPSWWARHSDQKGL